jgi:phage shock protein C
MSFSGRLAAHGPYKAKNGLVFGVAKGLANHFNTSAFLVRLLFIVVAVFFIFWPAIIIYLTMAFLLPQEPFLLPKTEQDMELWLLGQSDPKAAMDSLVRHSEYLEKKIRRLENYVTSKAFKKYQI